MRTLALALLAAVLLVALQAQAEPLQERADGAEAQEQPGADNQDFPISFATDASSDLRASGLRRRFICYCRRTCRYV
nr:defensin-6-like [Callithrix jacchus]